MRSVEFKEFIALLILFSSFIRVVQADKLIRKKCSVFSVSREHDHNGFKVSAKSCLNLCSHKLLKPNRNLLITLTPNRSQIPYILLPADLIKAKDFLQKIA